MDLNNLVKSASKMTVNEDPFDWAIPSKKKDKKKSKKVFIDTQDDVEIPATYTTHDQHNKYVQQEFVEVDSDDFYFPDQPNKVHCTKLNMIYLTCIRCMNYGAVEYPSSLDLGSTINCTLISDSQVLPVLCRECCRLNNQEKLLQSIMGLKMSPLYISSIDLYKAAAKIHDGKISVVLHEGNVGCVPISCITEIVDCSCSLMSIDVKDGELIKVYPRGGFF